MGKNVRSQTDNKEICYDFHIDLGSNDKVTGHHQPKSSVNVKYGPNKDKLRVSCYEKRIFCVVRFDFDLQT